MASYRVDVTNLTHHQPLSPAGVVLHADGYQAWSIGAAASAGLEHLAESGDADTLLNEALADGSVSLVDSGTSIVAPGTTESYTLTNVEHSSGLQLTLATMLVNTNDAFTGVSQVKIGQLSKDETMVLFSPVYDAGTEDNSESAATVPGQGGEGFNGVREAGNKILMHGGVVTQDDGLSGSALDESHRFDNPAARIVITRI